MSGCCSRQWGSQPHGGPSKCNACIRIWQLPFVEGVKFVTRAIDGVFKGNAKWINKADELQYTHVYIRNYRAPPKNNNNELLKF